AVELNCTRASSGASRLAHCDSGRGNGIGIPSRDSRLGRSWNARIRCNNHVKRQLGKCDATDSRDYIRSSSCGACTRELARIGREIAEECTSPGIRRRIPAEHNCGCVPPKGVTAQIANRLFESLCECGASEEQRNPHKPMKVLHACYPP